MPDQSILDDRVRETLNAHGLAYEVLACEPHAFHDQALFLESIDRSGV